MHGFRRKSTTERIVEAVAAGDADRAERLVREHVGDALEAFRSRA